jgi:carbonic anhydrase
MSVLASSEKKARLSKHATILEREDLPVVSVLACIDYRYTKFLDRVMRRLGHASNYFDVRCAGASFPLYFQDHQRRPECSCLDEHAQTIDVLAKGAIANLRTAANLVSHSMLYIIDHQDCGAFKAFMDRGGRECLAYPPQPSASQASKEHELSIHRDALMAAKVILSKESMWADIVVGVVDRAGAYGIYDETSDAWYISVPAIAFDAKALFSKNCAISKPTRPLHCHHRGPHASCHVEKFPPTPPMAPACSPRPVPKMYSEMALI